MSFKKANSNSFFQLRKEMVKMTFCLIISRSEHQDFLCCFQNLHHFFKTSQAVREASKTSIGQGFPGAVLFNETYFCLHMHRDIRASM